MGKGGLSHVKVTVAYVIFLLFRSPVAGFKQEEIFEHLHSVHSQNRLWMKLNKNTKTRYKHRYIKQIVIKKRT